MSTSAQTFGWTVPIAKRLNRHPARWRVEYLPHVRRDEIAFDDGNRVGEVAAGSALGAVEDDRRGVEQAEVAIEPRDCRFHHLRRAAVPAMRAI